MERSVLAAEADAARAGAQREREEKRLAEQRLLIFRAEFETALDNGETAREPVARALYHGVIDEAEAGRLLAAADAADRTASERYERIERTGRKLEDAVWQADLFDLENAEERAGLDAYYEDVVAPSLPALSPPARDKAEENFLGKSGFVARLFAQGLGTALASRDVAAVAAAARRVNRLAADEDILDQFTRLIPASRLIRARAIALYADLHMAPAEAVQRGDRRLIAGTRALRQKREKYVVFAPLILSPFFAAIINVWLLVLSLFKRRWRQALTEQATTAVDQAKESTAAARSGVVAASAKVSAALKTGDIRAFGLAQHELANARAGLKAANAGYRQAQASLDETLAEYAEAKSHYESLNDQETGWGLPGGVNFSDEKMTQALQSLSLQIAQALTGVSKIAPTGLPAQFTNPITEEKQQIDLPNPTDTNPPGPPPGAVTDLDVDKAPPSSIDNMIADIQQTLNDLQQVDNHTMETRTQMAGALAALAALVAVSNAMKFGRVGLGLPPVVPGQFDDIVYPGGKPPST